MANSSLLKRILTALVIGGLWLLLLFHASLVVFWLAMSMLGAIILWEYFDAVLPADDRGLKLIGVGLGIIPLLAAFFGKAEINSAGLVIAWLMINLLVVSRHSQLQDPFPLLSRITFGFVWIGFFASHLPLFMHFSDGPVMLLFLTAVTIASDTLAFFTGKYLGKNKLCPAVSPKKTVEGFLGGLAGGVGSGLLVAVLLIPGFSPIRTIILAGLLSAVSVVGDLTESVVKRWAGVKDSSAILPGHGGLLDRVDSLLLAAPLFFYLYNLGVLKP